MSHLTELGTAITVVFVVSVVALVAQILWVLLRSRKFRQGILAGGGARGDQESAGGGAIPAPPSKELLYFFCWKNQSRVEPDGAPRTRREIDDPDDDDGDGDELVKWQRLYGPPRLLFTINEEDREDTLDSDCGSNVKGKSGSSFSEKSDDKKSLCLRECLAEVDDEAPPDEPATIVLEVEEAVTPFSTPCSSPPYFTPSPSPARDDRQAEVPTTVVVVLDG